MENNTNENTYKGMNKCGCDCGTCSMAHNGKHHIVRKLFLVIILIVVFCIGANVGQMRVYKHMMRGGYGMMDRFEGGRMMKNRQFDYKAVPQNQEVDTTTPPPAVQ